MQIRIAFGCLSLLRADRKQKHAREREKGGKKKESLWLKKPQVHLLNTTYENCSAF